MLIALDVDGTLISPSGQIPTTTLSVLTRVKAQGHILTIVTGRGLPRLREALGVAGIQLFGATTLVAVEQGTRLITLDGKREFHHEGLDAARISQFLSSLPIPNVEFVAYHPLRTPLWSRVWTPNVSKVEELRLRMCNADVINSSPVELTAMAARDEPSMIVVRSSSPTVSSKIGGTWHTGLNSTLVASTETKSQALQRLCSLAGVPLDLTVVAGDDEADASMLRIVPPRRRIVVGSGLRLVDVAEPSCWCISTADDLASVIEFAMG